MGRDLGQWILAASALISISYMFGAAIMAWADRRIAGLKAEIEECERRDLRRKEDLERAWEYIRWLDRNTVRNQRGEPMPPRPHIVE